MAIRILATFSFVLGIMFWRQDPAAQVGLLGTLIAIVAWRQESRKLRSWGWLLLALAIGVTRSGYDLRFSPNPFKNLENRSLCLRGIVLDSPRQWGASTVFFLRVDMVNDESLSQTSIVLVRQRGAQDVVTPMERWQFRGRFSRGSQADYPGGFSQHFWLWTQRAEGVLKVGKFDEVSYLGPPSGWGPRALAAKLRSLMQERLAGIEDPVERALVSGVIFGDTQALPSATQDLFRRTGTTHLLAASGMNVALLVGILLVVARWRGVGAWRIAFLTIPVAVGYAFLAGCAPSITRAAVSAIVGMGAAMAGRRSSSWNSLCLSVWLLLLWEPRQIYDLGFQLSVVAVIGLIAGPSLGKNAPSWRSSLLMTVSAGLATLPIMWLTFHQLSPTLLPANLVLGPIVELLFPLGLLLTLLPCWPLYFLVTLISRLSLFLVGFLSKLADPVPLSQPGYGPLLLLALALALWSGLIEYLEIAGPPRWLAIPLAALALAWGQWQGLKPLAESDQLIIRRIGSESSYYWLSSKHSEMLVLSDSWQEARARNTLLELGCLKKPSVVIDKAFDARWGGFCWKRIEPYLPRGRFVEVRTKGCDYIVNFWRPTDEG